MKLKLSLKLLLFLLLANAAPAQEKELLEKLKGYDLSQVINPDSISDESFEMIEHGDPYGYIGSDYQRFRIHFTSFARSKSDPLLYNIKGKTKVKGNVCNFTGTLRVTAAEKDEFSIIDILDTEDRPKYSALSVISDIEMYEDNLQKGSGVIRGAMVTDMFFDEKGKLQYNALMLMADGYANNQFTGTWTSYKTGLSKKCNWGDYRIPESGDLDYGAGEFSVNEKYRSHGWETFYDSYCCSPDKPRTQAARKKEAEKWWL